MIDQRPHFLGYRLLLATVAVAMAVVAVAPSVGARVEQADPELRSATEGLAEIASCAEGKRHVLVELLLDQSGSLGYTDPDAQRVLGAQLVTRGLADAVEISGERLKVEVSIAGFDGDYRPGDGWRQLRPETLVDVNAEIDAFAARDVGVDTDYVSALQGAQADLEARATTVGGETCQVLLWFTDGQLEILDRIGESEGKGVDESGEWRTKSWAPDLALDRKGGGREAKSRARDLLCERGGIADQLHAGDVSIVALPLTATISSIDVDFLGSIAVHPYGDAPRCGAKGSATTGAVLPAHDVSQLIAAFDEVAQTLTGGSDAGTSEVPLCKAKLCEKGLPFEIDDTLQRFHVLADTGAPGISVLLQGPGTEVVTLPDEGQGKVKVGDAEVAYRWITDSAMVLDVVRPVGDDVSWSGTWKLTFVDRKGDAGGAATSRIYLYGDLVPRLESPDEVAMGDEARLRVAVVHRDGTPEVRPDFIDKLELSVSVTDPATGKVVKLDRPKQVGESNVFEVSYTVPNPSTGRTIKVVSTLEVETKAGISLEPARSTGVLDVRPPLAYPIVLTEKVNMGPVTGTGHATGVLEVQGSPKGDGCIWVTGTAYDVVPESAGEIATTVDGDHVDQASCLAVKRNERLELRFTSTPGGTARGTASGLVSISASATGNKEIITVDVPVDLALRRPIDETKRLWILVLLTVIGILLPLLATWLAKVWNARFEEPTSLSMAVIPVKVTSRGVIRVDNKAQLVDYFDFDPTALSSLSGRRRTLDVGSQPDGSTRYHLSAVLTPNPFRPPFGQVEGPALEDRRAPVVGSEPPAFYRNAGRLPLGLGNAWFFAADPVMAAAMSPSADEILGELVCFGESQDLARAVLVLNDDVKQHLHAAFDQLTHLIQPDRPSRITGDSDQVEWGGDDGPAQKNPDHSKVNWDEPTDGSASVAGTSMWGSEGADVIAPSEKPSWSARRKAKAQAKADRKAADAAFSSGSGSATSGPDGWSSSASPDDGATPSAEDGKSIWDDQS